MDGWMDRWMDGWINKKGELFFMAECWLKMVGRIMDLENYLTTHIAEVVLSKNYQWMLKLMGGEKQDTPTVSE